MRTSGGKNLSKEKNSTLEGTGKEINIKDADLYEKVAFESRINNKFSWKSVIEKLNHDHGYKIINCDYERRRIKRIVEKRLASYGKKNSSIVDEESTTQIEKDLSFHKSWLNSIQPSEKYVDVSKMMKVYYKSMVAKVKRIIDINQIEDMFEKSCIKSSKSFITLPKKLIINKYTAPVWMLVDNLLQTKLQQEEYKDNYENGLKTISAAMYTISQLTTFNSEKTTRNKIKKLKKMIVNGRRKVEILKTIKTRPSSEAASLLNELRLKFPKRKNYKVKEFIQFLEWNIRSKELDLARIEKNEKRKLLRLAYAKTPSIKLIRKLSGIRSNSNVTEVQLSTAVKYYENLFKEKKVSDISDFKNYCNTIKDKFSQVDIDKDELREDILLAINEASPWKAAGNDLLPCAAFKYLKAVKLWEANMVEKIILEGVKLPDYAYEGKTFLLFKSGNPEDPSCYRPITVLNSFTKILSSTINKQIHRYCGKLIQINQMANKPELWGTATAKFIDSTIAMDSKAAKKPLHMAWIDYTKAYDSLSHEAIRYLWNALPLPNQIKVTFLNGMDLWATRLCLRKCTSKKIKISSGIMQGDAASPTIFTLMITYISEKLLHLPKIQLNCGSLGLPNELKCLGGWNHTFFMDDLKLYASTEKELKQMITTVCNSSRQIGLVANQSKCGIISTDGNVIIKNENCTVVQDMDEITIPGITEDTNPYKYIGLQQKVFDTEKSLDILKDKLLGRMEEILQLDLKVSDIIDIYNLTIPSVARFVLAHLNTTGKISSTFKYLEQKLDRMVVKKLREANLLQSNNSTSRLYIKQSKSGFGLANIRIEGEIAFCKAVAYNLMNLLTINQTWCQVALVKKQRKNFITDLLQTLQNHMDEETVEDLEICFEEAIHNIKNGIKIKNIPVILKTSSRTIKFNTHKEFQKFIGSVIYDNFQNELWDKYSQHMRFPKWIAEVGHENIYHYWIKAMDIKNTKIVVACQEEQVSLRAHPAMDNTNKNCRVCDAELETVRHVINECSHYKNTLYKARHNWVASTIMKHLCKRFKIQFARNGENDKCKFVYDSPWTISVNLKHHIPDIVLQDKEKKVIYVIEVSCPWFGFMHDQLNIKRVKYTVHSKSEVGLDWRSYKKDMNFCDALSLQEKMKVVFLPVIISSTGQVFKETQDLFERYFGPSKGLFILLSRYSVLGTTRIIKWHFASSSNQP